MLVIRPEHPSAKIKDFTRTSDPTDKHNIFSSRCHSDTPVPLGLLRLQGSEVPKVLFNKEVRWDMSAILTAVDLKISITRRQELLELHSVQARWVGRYSSSSSRPL